MGNAPMHSASKGVFADLVFMGGTILTMSSRNPTAEAIATKGERIVAVGKKDDMIELIGPSTRVVELQGSETLMPGFIEPHTHPSLLVKFSTFFDVSGFACNTFQDVKNVIDKAVKETEKKPQVPLPWMVFKGWDPALINDLPPLNAKELDTLVSPKYPVLVLGQMLHSYWLNTKGLEVCNFTKDTPDPKGGVIVRDEKGNPSGMLKEITALELAMESLPQPSPLEMAKQSFDTLRQYSQLGFTTITDLGTISLDEFTLAFLSFITLCPECPVRIGVFYTPGNKPPVHYVNKKLWFPGVKIWADGSPYTGSMAVREPYLQTSMTEALDFDPNCPRGFLIYDSTKHQADTVRPYQSDLIATHAQGERAIDQSLDVYEKLIDEQGPGDHDHRYRLEHVGLITKDQLQRATDLGVTVTVFVDHVYYYGVALRDGILGKDRAERFAPVGLATQCGQKHWTLHVDSPCCPNNLFLSMKTAITRCMLKDDGVLEPPNENYRATIDEVLKAYTINAAWQLKREHDLGSLDVGKIADLVILSDNPKAVNPETLTRIKVLETYLGGERFK